MALRADDSTALSRPRLVASQPFLGSEQQLGGQGPFEPAANQQDIAPRPNENTQMRRRGAITGFIKVCERWQLSSAQQIALLGYTENPFVGAQILRGQRYGGQDVKDRVGYLLGIAIGLRALFNNTVVNELRWLQAERADIGNTSSLNFMLEGKMINLLRVLELVDRERAL
jgi:hypothetical protein